ncbi:hypothetical protein P879_01856 [Paragonimus westermani]|uniref:Uncharacterized protein n=1 Tax=Paragonimus westermani TaxID=34504 RepID=A0A8T0DNZ3_9TREM|nr:hypothetical protein P879_01856 [Paragonimus westermani]
MSFSDYEIPHGRHNPHPHRVTHFPGLLGLPVRAVNDPPTQPPHDKVGFSRWKTFHSNTVPTGLSPKTFDQYKLFNASVGLERSTSSTDQGQGMEKLSNYYNQDHATTRIPAGLLPLSQPRRIAPNFDTITGLQYFTGLRNFSVRQKPAVLGRLTETDCAQKNGRLTGACSQADGTFTPRTFAHNSRWKSELGSVTETVLSKYT